MPFYFHYNSNAINSKMYLLELINRYKMASPKNQSDLTIYDK